MRKAGAVAAILSACMCGMPQPPIIAGEQQWTAVTLARDGAIGNAIHSSRAKAVSLAIAECKQMTRWSNDCGSLLVTMQEGWAIAVLCGTYNILVAGGTLAVAEAEATRREERLRAKHAATMPDCVPIAIIDSKGMSQ